MSSSASVATVVSICLMLMFNRNILSKSVWNPIMLFQLGLLMYEIFFNKINWIELIWIIVGIHSLSVRTSKIGT